jgi:phosphoadenosine phosphosulfate reductase
MKLNSDSPSSVMMATRASSNKPKTDFQLRELASSLDAVLKNLTSAEDRLRYILQIAQQSTLTSSSESMVALTTSFGIQSALMLHMVTQAQSQTRNTKKMPVIWIDTGYLPPETYHFAEHLKELYDLDLRTYQSAVSPAHMEALYGPNLWEQSHQQYNYLRKVEPMQRALTELDVTMVVSGVRANQTKHRQQMKMVHVHKGRIKICPILDWSDEDVVTYFDKHKLPYHPLYTLGYRTVGDQHSSQPFDPSIHANERDTRFHGRVQECGLHVSDDDEAIPHEQKVVTVSSSVQEQQPASTDSGFVLYTKPKCRFCRAAKELIGYLRQQHLLLVFVQEYEVGRDIQLHELKQRLCGRSVTTVPQIWYENNYIGGYDNLVEWVQEAFPNIVGLPDPEKLDA